MKHLLLLLSLLVTGTAAFAQSRYVSATTKQIVYTRDRGVCKCCGSSLNLEYDHIMPHSCGGSNDVTNIQLLCQSCNRSKSNSCTCKIHNRTVGYNCCQNSTTVRKPSAAVQCSGLTKSRTRCRNRTTHSSGRCHFHQ
jgi:hypothetical protein